MGMCDAWPLVGAHYRRCTEIQEQGSRFCFVHQQEREHQRRDEARAMVVAQREQARWEAARPAREAEQRARELERDRRAQVAQQASLQREIEAAEALHQVALRNARLRRAADREAARRRARQRVARRQAAAAARARWHEVGTAVDDRTTWRSPVVSETFAVNFRETYVDDAYYLDAIEPYIWCERRDGHVAVTQGTGDR